MYGMEYRFTLPDDYNMDVVRARVVERSPFFDKLEGLYEKAFLISEKSTTSESQNCYAPFYVWNDAESMKNFLLGEKFGAVTEAFGRPAVRSWLPIAFASGRAKLQKPRFATREITRLSTEVNLAKLRISESKLHRQWIERPDNQSAFIGIDPTSWEIVRLALWRDLPENLDAGVEVLQVLHLSAPSLDPSFFVSPC